MGGGISGGAWWWKLKKSFNKLTCCSSCPRQQTYHVSSNSPIFSSISSEIVAQINSTTTPNLCAICLDLLNYSSGSSPGQPIFTAQCSHSFHFACISSNVRHGSITCPICRSQWSQLPRNLNTHSALHYNKIDPVLQILDDSIANSRVHRRSFLHSTRYDDDDPIEPYDLTEHPRLQFSLLNLPFTHSSSSSVSNDKSYLHVKLSNEPAIDLVLVASPNGPHLRLMKQAMALVVFSMRPMDRVAIVTYSSSATRIFPLRRMSSYGKKTALQVIDWLFYTGQAEPLEGLKKGVKVLEDRVHKNPRSCILHLTDTPSRSYHQFDIEVELTIHRFNVGYGFGASNEFIMHEFEEFLTRTLGGAIRDIKLRIGESEKLIRIDELRGGEERNIPLHIGEFGHMNVEYSYVDGEDEKCVRTGESVVRMADKGGGNESRDDVTIIGGRMNSAAEKWEYHDPFMARRWAKHLHAYRL